MSGMNVNYFLNNFLRATGGVLIASCQSQNSCTSLFNGYQYQPPFRGYQYPPQSFPGQYSPYYHSGSLPFGCQYSPPTYNDRVQSLSDFAWGVDSVTNLPPVPPSGRSLSGFVAEVDARVPYAPVPNNGYVSPLLNIGQSPNTTNPTNPYSTGSNCGSPTGQTNLEDLIAKNGRQIAALSAQLKALENQANGSGTTAPPTADDIQRVTTHINGENGPYAGNDDKTYGRNAIANLAKKMNETGFLPAFEVQYSRDAKFNKEALKGASSEELDGKSSKSVEEMDKELCLDTNVYTSRTFDVNGDGQIDQAEMEAMLLVQDMGDTHPTDEVLKTRSLELDCKDIDGKITQTGVDNLKAFMKKDRFDDNKKTIKSIFDAYKLNQ
jgi:hypothetical protein